MWGADINLSVKLQAELGLFAVAIQNHNSVAPEIYMYRRAIHVRTCRVLQKGGISEFYRKKA